MQQRLEYKFRLQQFQITMEDAVLYLFGSELIKNISLDTLRFLCLNPVKDFDEVRRIAVEASIKRKSLV